jgi:hypothetical protein
MAAKSAKTGKRRNETFNDTLNLSTVTARLSYKFGGPGVTRY